jgi:hypothetical protein
MPVGGLPAVFLIVAGRPEGVEGHATNHVPEDEDAYRMWDYSSGVGSKYENQRTFAVKSKKGVIPPSA